MTKCPEFAIYFCKPFRKTAVIKCYSGKLVKKFTKVTGHNFTEKKWILFGRNCRDFTPK